MKDAQAQFHSEWLGLAQPMEGLVFSVPVLADAQIAPRAGPDVTARFAALLDHDDEGPFVRSLVPLFEDFLGYDRRGMLVGRDALPPDLHFYAEEGRQDIRPSFAIARGPFEVEADDPLADFGEAPENAEAAAEDAAASPWVTLVWDVRDEAGADALGLDLDASEDRTGSWRYPPTAKLERLLRHAGIPMGLLSNGRELRLVYAPAGETTSHLTFRFAHMEGQDGRKLVAALDLLLGASRAYGAAPEHTALGMLRASRSRQADVTEHLAEQVFEAVEVLVEGFERAAARDAAGERPDWLRAALEDDERDHFYQGVLSVVLRLVFILYSENKGLLPITHPVYRDHLSVQGLFARLVDDAGLHPESMHHRFGAYGRLLALFRAVYLGVSHGTLALPPRRGRLFDPSTFPFLEGGLPGSTAAIVRREDRTATHPPSVDDGTVLAVLERLIVFEGQRLSYASLDVEQIGSVYESLMGFEVHRVVSAAARIGKNRVWAETGDLRARTPTDRKKWLKETCGLSAAQIKTVDELLTAHATDDALAGGLQALSPGRKGDRERHRAPASKLVLQPGEERRRSGSHYTPRSLTERIVRRTLEPLLACLGEAPTEEQLLSLKICDPAMGSGAFLVETCRQMSEHVVTAWTRAGRLAGIAEEHGEPRLVARRLVAQRCLYGVDKNAAAVELAKLSLWLVTMSAELPFTFVDHALRHGDSLVGFDLDQTASFHWKPTKQLLLFKELLRDSLDQAIAHRKEILDLARSETPRAQEEKRRLLDHASHATERIRTIADVCIGAFFAETKDKAREKERLRRKDVVERWLGGDAEALAECAEMAREIRRRHAPFHWWLEFPEVFYEERPDPLDGGKVNGAAYMEGFVGNPPFAGKNTITVAHGAAFIDWMMAKYAELKGKPNTDLCAYFFRRGAELMGPNGSLGFVATNTIAQGDSRLMSLHALVCGGAVIHDATTSFVWPGAAAVSAAMIHVAFGTAARSGGRGCVLDGARASAINSRLLEGPERPDPAPLGENRDIAFMGGKLVGIGLAVSTEDYERLVHDDPANAQILRPYLGGEEVNSNPTGAHDRYMIDFSAHTLEEARRWPALLEIAEREVKPARMKDKRGTYKTYWWRPGESGGALYAALAGLKRCLVTARVTKHLCFSFQGMVPFFNEKLYVFALDAWTALAVLQSRVHETWARLLSSTMKTDLNYSGSDCFDTFPFPEPDPRAVIPALETAGEPLYEARARFMVDTDQGLTKTYNALKDPRVTDAHVVELRRLHEAMDRAVLDAYAWTDVEVPPFCPATAGGEEAVEGFKDEVIERLYLLNAERAGGGARAGPKDHGERERRKAKRGDADKQEELF